MWRSVHYNTSPDGTLFSGDGSGTDAALVYGQPKRLEVDGPPPSAVDSRHAGCDA